MVGGAKDEGSLVNESGGERYGGDSHKEWTRCEEDRAAVEESEKKAK